MYNHSLPISANKSQSSPFELLDKRSKKSQEIELDMLQTEKGLNIDGLRKFQSQKEHRFNLLKDLLYTIFELFTLGNKNPNAETQTSYMKKIKAYLHQISTSTSPEYFNILSYLPSNRYYNEEVFQMLKAIEKQSQTNLQLPVSTYYPAVITEVQENWVYMDCLLDPEEQVFEERRFMREVIEGALPLEKGTFVKIGIHKSPGRLCYHFTPYVTDAEKNLFNLTERTQWYDMYGNLINEARRD